MKAKSKIAKDFRFSLLNVLKLFKNPQFILLTVIGNSIVMAFAWAFYYLEHDVNHQVTEFIDAIWWAFSTVTTVGYGDTTPVSYTGKLLGISLMLVGTALFATYTALFARAFLAGEVFHLRKIEQQEGVNLKLLKELREQLDKLDLDRH